MSGSRIVIGTRGSALARWQAGHIAAELRRAHPDLVITEKIVVTEGDRSQTGPVIDLGGKGVWVKEIEEGLLAGEIDLAVHSLKDVPAHLAPGLALVAIPRRADPRDALVSRSGASLTALPPGARVGTSSLRRVCQLRAVRGDLAIELLRGNVDTRLRKVADGVVDAAILACAGLDRLGFSDRITQRLSPELMLPAIGQGALALEARSDDARVRGLCRSLADPDAEVAVAAERALLAALGVGCRTPVAGHATLGAGRLVVRGLVGRPDASEMIHEMVEGLPGDAAALGAQLGRQLLDRGAGQILRELEN
ncbi:MAG TPA: hydroxymethylbilane synthase [Polyangia bacterium]|jgi:hydroxymethylbilane synthase|nr:hydroxymethylbilane synthase [Polyangia bacterium]